MNRTLTLVILALFVVSNIYLFIISQGVIPWIAGFNIGMFLLAFESSYRTKNT